VAKIIEGERIGKLGKLALGCSATIFDSTRQKVLLTRRTDNGRWCLPGGRAEPGENVVETCLRETLEETGLQVRMVRLLGVYSSPHRMVEYPDGNRYQVVALNFEVEPRRDHTHGRHGNTRRAADGRVLWAVAALREVSTRTAGA
jgi:ADP-ribose pyrophosphatase YjhB (NUDIX family)